MLGMTSTIKQSSTELASFLAIVAAILATMFVTYLCLIYAGKLSEKLGPMGIDAVTRIVGFFVSAMGVALIFDGVIEALETHGITAFIDFLQCCPPIPPAMSAIGVRREKAALPSGCKAHPATAPAGSNRSSHGGNEVAGAFG